MFDGKTMIFCLFKSHFSQGALESWGLFKRMTACTSGRCQCVGLQYFRWSFSAPGNPPSGGFGRKLW